MKNIGIALSILLNLASASAFALDIHRHEGNRFDLTPGSFADDRNLGNMCNGRENSARNNAAPFNLYVGDQIVTRTIPGGVNQAYQQQCNSGCDSTAASCESNLSGTATGCYTDSNNNVVCPINQLNSGMCSQLGSCQQAQQQCYQSCAQQSQLPPTEEHKCDITIASQSPGISLTYIQMDGNGSECDEQLRQDQAGGFQIVTDEYQDGSGCHAQEILVDGASRPAPNPAPAPAPVPRPQPTTPAPQPGPGQRPHHGG